MTVNKMVRIITGSILCGFVAGELNLGTELAILFGLCFGAFIMTFE